MHISFFIFQSHIKLCEVCPHRNDPSALRCENHEPGVEDTTLRYGYNLGYNTWSIEPVFLENVPNEKYTTGTGGVQNKSAERSSIQDPLYPAFESGLSYSE